MENNKYTLENLPVELYYNQCYCFNNHTGEISIGEIVGHSALSSITTYNINGRIIKSHQSLDKWQNNIKKLSSTPFSLFLNYQDFVKFYTEYIAKKEKAKKTRIKARYEVDTETFFCKKTASAWTHGVVKEFDSKEEAVNYATKGLEKLLSQVTKLIEEYKNVLDVISKEYKSVNSDIVNVFDTHEVKTYMNYKLIATPEKLKENDVVFKVVYDENYKEIKVYKIAPDSETSVKGFVSPYIAKLSNGEVLINSECLKSYYPPFMAKYEDMDKVILANKFCVLDQIKSAIDRELHSLNRILEYAKIYKPLSKSFSSSPYFGKAYRVKKLNEIKKYIKGLE